MLETAVDHCIIAAGHEIDTSTQKLLMKVCFTFSSQQLKIIF